MQVPSWFVLLQHGEDDLPGPAPRVCPHFEVRKFKSQKVPKESDVPNIVSCTTSLNRRESNDRHLTRDCSAVFQNYLSVMCASYFHSRVH